MTFKAFGVRIAPCILAVAFSSCAGGGASDGEPTSPPAVRSGTATIALDGAPPGTSAIRLRVVGRGISLPVERGAARILLQRTISDTLTFVLAIADASAQPLLGLSLANLDNTIALFVDEASAGKSLGYKAMAATDVRTSATKQ